MSYSKGKEEIIEYWLEMNRNLSLDLGKRNAFQMIQKCKRNRSKSEMKVKESE